MKRASEVLKRFFDDRTIQEASRFEAFRSTWKQIVGQRLADHSRPKSVKHRTLLIAADHAGWIQLLQMDQERILERISKHYPELKLTSLAFSVEMMGGEEERDQDVAPAMPEGSSAERQEASASPSTHSISHARNRELPQALDDIFSRMRSKDAERTREKGN